ncbi:PREDICTED: beta-1,3-galactosyltransferase 5-like isoform X2 [Nicrophorus vespilloides]|uniref:Hexosyltransferase n=1 Tax=Nicrophorus vespilloides TaxID=110193 RepID=A0ABM1NFA7_NICVS|nr:PREDICTED: beta-1,3-galactosyltransferase 5-like isoform X2 [Nicrophorus vespilloides]
MGSAKGMGIPCATNCKLQCALFIIGLLSLVYVLYNASPQLIVAPQAPQAHVMLNISNTMAVTTHNASLLTGKNATTVSEAAPAGVQQPHQDLTRGVPAEFIYEAGHVGFNSDICPDLGKNLQLLIAITSAPSHQSSRMAIRQTWGHYGSRRDVAITFMLGTTSNQTLIDQIKEEEFLYGDIITGKFIDTYDNLTLKTISMLEWVDNYCPKASFVLKTDDDMFINVSRLLAFIGKHKPEQRNIYGRLAKKWKPIRNKKSKYYISPQQYKPAVFPDFTTGPAYLLPARLAKELYTAALNHTYFKLEDVFVTGIVANSLKIKRVHAPEFLNKRVSLTPCAVQRGISIHMVKGAEQYDLWKKLLDGLAKCK